MESLRIENLNIQTDVDLSRHCTWRIGGPARFFVDAANTHEVMEALYFARSSNQPLLLLGNGSNLLFESKGFPGLVLRIASEFEQFQIREGEIIAPAGRKLPAFVRYCQSQNCHRFDPLASIPGNIGGSIVNNAGAFGQEVAEHLLWVEGIDLKSGQFRHLPKKDIYFAYRKCGLRGKFLVLRAGFAWTEQKDESEAQKEMSRYRKKTQPWNYPSAGCTFKNPAGDSAGRLIDLAGCKLMRVGDASVSDLHANFILNMEGATDLMVKELILKIQEEVLQKTGVHLEREIQFSEEAMIHLS